VNPDNAAWRRVLGLVGLGARGRLVVVGVEQVRLKVRGNAVHYAIVSGDVSQHSKDKIVPLLRARGVEFVEGVAASELGAAVGKETTAVVGIVDRDLARGVREIVGASSGGAQQEVGFE
jgi:ribosomal protein L7Ae-like RNA K-turn-binding protein